MNCKIKPIHWILIALILVEIVAVVLFCIPRSQSNEIPQMVELSTTYDKTQSGLCEIQTPIQEENNLSLDFVKASNPDETLHFNGTPFRMSMLHESFTEFQEMFKDSTKDDWNSYRDTAYSYTSDLLATDNNAFSYACSIASGWYNVTPSCFSRNAGIYAITLQSTSNHWNQVFEQYLYKFQDGTVADEIALPASVVINKHTYSAMVYMSRAADKVTMRFMFGETYIDDFTKQTVDIYIFDANAQNALAHTIIEAEFLASETEIAYRKVFNSGGSR
jgi:hypothetical protein